MSSFDPVPPGHRETWDPDWSPEPGGVRDDDVSAIGLLTVARYVWRCMREVVGGPDEIARCGPIGHRWWADIMFWLGDVERLVRSVLCIMAMALALPRRESVIPPREQENPGGARSTPVRNPGNPDDPASWRVTFAVMRGQGGGDRSQADLPSDTLGVPAIHSSLAMARRLEALLRVLNDPEPFARRLALRLSRLPAAPVFRQRPEPAPKPPRFIRGRGLCEFPRKLPGPCVAAIMNAGNRLAELFGAYWAPG